MDEDELDEEISNEVKNADSIIEIENGDVLNQEIVDEDESDKEIVNAENIVDSIVDTDNGDELHDYIAKENTDEENIVDSITGNCNEGDRCEILYERQALDILPHQTSSLSYDSFLRDSDLFRSW